MIAFLFTGEFPHCVFLYSEGSYHIVAREGATYLGIKSKSTLKRFAVVGLYIDVHPRLNLLHVRWHFDSVFLKTSQTQRVCILSLLKTKWNKTHSYEIAAMNALKTFRYNRLNTLFIRELLTSVMTLRFYYTFLM
jgi:hypothetical protein